MKSRHLVAGVIHLLAVISLIAVAAVEQPLSNYDDNFWLNPKKWSVNPRLWLYQCADKSVSPVSACKDEDKQFYVNIPEGARHVNIVWLATSYVLWSSLQHFYTHFHPETERIARWCDYSVTAPTMLTVVGLAFGGDSVTVLIVAPLGLALLLVIAAIVERRSDEIKGYRTASREAIVVMLFLLYPITVSPVMYSSIVITHENRADIPDRTKYDAGVAPVFVPVFAALVIVAFTTFGVVYAYDWVSPLGEKDRERWYITLSMASKTSLHLFLGLSVINQGTSLGTDEPGGRSSMETLQYGLIGSAVAVAFSVLLNKYGFDDGPPKGEVSRALL